MLGLGPCEGGNEDEGGEEHYLLELLVRAMGKKQVRGEFQEGGVGKCKKKELEELSWRGIIRYLSRTNRVMVCKCDGKKPKQTEWVMTKHIERGMHDLETEMLFIFTKGK